MDRVRVEDDPVFDVKKAREKLRRFVEGHDHAIRIKAEIMVDRFHDQVLAQGKIGGERERWSSPTASSAPSSTFRHPRLPEGTQEPVPGHPGPFHAGRTSIHVGGRP